jgi:hypothetical protein
MSYFELKREWKEKLNKEDKVQKKKKKQKEINERKNK